MMQQHSFTFNFSKFIKKVIPILVLIIGVICGVKVLDYVFFQVEEYTRTMWKSFYSQDKIDTVFIGSSHVYNDIDVDIVDQRLGVDSFDISSPGQRIQQSYWNLLEADRVYNIQNAFIELYYVVSTGIDGDYSGESAMKNGWRDTDYMKTSHLRLAAISKMNDTEHLFEAMMPFIRFRNYLFDWGYIANVHDSKITDNYKKYIYYHDFDGNGYEETDISSKGFLHSTRVLDTVVFDQSRIPDEMKITEDAKKYLVKCIKYCEDKNINLTLIISPMYEVQTISTEGYDIYYDSVKEIADEYKVPLYDFNLVKEEYLQLDKSEFYDMGHLNTKGAKKYTTCLMDVLQSDNKEIYFYESFEERMKKITPQVYGYYWKTDEESNERLLRLATSDCSEMEFRVILTSDEESEQRMLQDFKNNKQFNVPTDEHGTLTVVWRLAGNNDEVVCNEFTY